MRLNIGCGRDVRPTWINADLYPVDSRVFKLDADSAGWPWTDEMFDFVDAQDLLEHLDRPMLFLRECYRVLKPDGKLRVRSPHFTSRNVATDLTHRRGLSSETLIWAAQTDGKWTVPGAMPWRQVHVRLDFEPWCMPFVGWVNLRPILMKLYEATPLRVFPARNVTAVLTK